jgi:hypothetical protein
MTTETATASTATTDAGTTQDTTTAAVDQTTATTTTTEVKGDANADTSTQDGVAKNDGKADDAPPVYDFKAPEGVELDATAVDRFKTVAGELKLPAESAQKVVDLYADIRKAEAEAFANQVQAWGDEVKADKELGGDKLAENLAVAKKAVDAFGSDEIRSLLDSTGMGNHPAVVRMMVKIGKAISEDGFVKGAPPTPAKSFYDNSNMN